MKKILIILALLGILFSIKSPSEEKEEEIRAVFISYIELSKYIDKSSQEKSKENIDKMINNCKNTNINTIILHTIISTDSIYKSNIYPFSSYISKKEGAFSFDILKYFRDKTKENNMKLISWINPYRIRTTPDISTITNNSPAYKYINTDYIYIKDGIYWNPSKKEVEDLIIRGVEEILSYEVDGILMDDYFYPDNDIDNDDYLKSNTTLSKEEYHLEVINHMVKRVYEECKKKNILFGISPDGNISNNYNIHYADVKRWLKEDGYLDFIMPQIYYGFYNSIKGFKNTIIEWENLIKKENIMLIPALAFYKIGKIDSYAKEGREEWIYNDNIIMREVIIARNRKHYMGFSLFRYDNIFEIDNYTSNSLEEIENLKKLIK